MKNKKLRVVLGLIVAAVALAACGAAKNASSEKESTVSSAESSDTASSADAASSDEKEEEKGEEEEEVKEKEEEIEEEEEMATNAKDASASVAAPTAEAFADEYFGSLTTFGEGVSGLSLKQAQAAVDVITFASENRIADCDNKEMRANMLSAWEEMDQEDQQIFDEHIMESVTLIDRCVDDWESNKGAFSDAGVEDEMDKLLSDKDAMAQWDSLKSNTLTMGNSEE